MGANRVLCIGGGGKGQNHLAVGGMSGVLARFSWSFNIVISLLFLRLLAARELLALV